MKLFHTIGLWAACLCAAAFTACAASSPVTAGGALSIPVITSTSSVTDQAKALDAATAVVDGVEVTVDTAAKTGVLKGSAAVTAGEDLTTLHNTLVAAQQAFAAENATTLAAQLTAITNLAATIQSLAAGG